MTTAAELRAAIFLRSQRRDDVDGTRIDLTDNQIGMPGARAIADRFQPRLVKGLNFRGNKNVKNDPRWER